MRTMIVILWSVLCVSALSGCQSTPPAEVQIRYQTVLVAPPDDLIQNCEVQAPPDVNTYLALPTWNAKEGMLIDNTAKQIELLGLCNVRWKNLRDWKSKQTTAIEAAQSASGPTR